MFLKELWDDILKQRKENGQPGKAKTAQERQADQKNKHQSDAEKRKEEMKKRAHKNGNRDKESDDEAVDD